MNYKAPIWLPGGHLQTIWPALAARRAQCRARPGYRRERWITPDQDFIDVDFLMGAPGAVSTSPVQAPQPLLVLFHGLEGSSRSHYAEAFADWAAAQGWAYAVPHFRGCSGELNWAPRVYHSGDHAEIHWILASMRTYHAGPIVAVGVSLGGNALLRWAAEAGTTATQSVQAVAAVCSPLDLVAAGRAMGEGLNRHLYTRMFLRTMLPKAMAKWRQHPGLFDRAALASARDLYAFDDLFTAPLHGFSGVDDYWRRASAKPLLSEIRLPALVLNARNDPFVPSASLPTSPEVGTHVTLWQPEHGGHVGFAVNPWPGHLHALPETVGRWLSQQWRGSLGPYA